MTDSQTHRHNPLHELLGGRRGAIESALPSVVFVTVYLSTGAELGTGLIAALLTAAALAAARVWRREKPVRVVGGLAAVALAAVVAARTGNASDYFLPSLLANLASALVWAASILARWPMLGVIMGFALGQRTRWRGDPDLLRAYSRASWIWAGSFLVRAGINLPLYLTDNIVGLGISRVLLGWPMVLLVIALSWAVIMRSLPPGHPGVRHPQVPADYHDDGDEEDEQGDGYAAGAVQ
ncbi:MAG: hypothetical protein QG597_827 [Actinomycetota bacterium]|nr:hypothetical protein [Actinomycetota bacterium]